ncbi:hypothetical protein RHMOL_Rhmol09G0189400 [Rhododendron molle]|uniref:Uncharacterized protein n=2 Tax=Rhododendron molle TaxID=49168 RepID=A0ACC0MEN8_RHOML|nr:hypothetical protein RHMOL_Rhmol09G0189400 [Rhododendron molle]KAI8539523.1 hypothetical protein RHMOL_Rhmol09G0189400 [Rhododendron molle]
MSIGRKGMDASNQKSIERVVSQRALQMGSSFPCQICVVGFLCGVCLATFFLAALTSLGTFAFGGISFSASSNGITSWNSSSDIINMVTKGDCNLKPREIGWLMHSQLTFDSKIDARVSFLYSAWSASLNEPVKGEGELLQGVGVRRSNVPKAPHLENCKLSSQVNKNLDKRVENESFPPWTLWKGFLHTYPLSTAGERLKSEGAYPPWASTCLIAMSDWGNPWRYLQPTTDINGTLIASHRKMDRRWWRAQAVRYLMRFQTEYTCNLLNTERHAAFGWEAAKLVLATPSKEWPEEVREEPQSEMEQFVWSNHKPWMPRPLLSVHVRMGDKACEMKIFEFEEYMKRAERIRKHFPHLVSIWLSTEMQEVIDRTRSYPHWNFYYTNVTRQVGNMSMATYEASLGRETSTNYPLVNFLMAAESDFFVGALGSSWCFLIDGMRNTGGKVMAGYLSVNKDRFW